MGGVDLMSDTSKRVTLISGVALFVIAAVVTISLIRGVLNFGAYMPGTGGPVLRLGIMLYSVYGLSAFLIPVFFLVAGIFCFDDEHWSVQRKVCLAISVVPFFTVVLAEHACRKIALYDVGPLAVTKILILMAIAILFAVMEYLLAIVLSTESMRKKVGPKLKHYTESAVNRAAKIVKNAHVPHAPQKTAPEQKTHDMSDASVVKVVPVVTEEDIRSGETPEDGAVEETSVEEPLTPEERELKDEVERSIDEAVDSMFRNPVSNEDMGYESDGTWNEGDSVDMEEAYDDSDMQIPDDDEDIEAEVPSVDDGEELVEETPVEEAAGDGESVEEEFAEDVPVEKFPDEAESVEEAFAADAPVAEVLGDGEPVETASEAVEPVSEEPEVAAQDAEPQNLPSIDSVFARMQEDAKEAVESNGMERLPSESEVTDTEEVPIDDGQESEVDDVVDNDGFEGDGLVGGDIEDDSGSEDEPFAMVEDDDIAEEESEPENGVVSDDAGIVEDVLETEEDVVPDDDDTADDETESEEDVEDEQSVAEDEGRSVAEDDEPVLAEAKPVEPPRPVHARGPYKISTDLLTEYDDNPYWIIDDETNQAAESLKATLNEFGIKAEVTGIRKGPVVTMFEMLPAPGVKLSKIVNLQDNIALRLAASSVRIVAPIPGKKAVGIEIPNKNRAIVSFRECIEQDIPEWKKMAVPVILGKDIQGETQIMDLVKTPHLLIAGATGAGKSVCVNSMILSILYKRSPDQVKLILVDPKIVELKLYNDIPHLLTPVITEPKKAMQALQYCLCEMERRYALLDHMGVRDISSYNKRITERKIAQEKIPYLIVVIDEFADLMATTGKQLESVLARLAAMSRAVGIHLVLATQRPSIDVITGLIKANIPSRIAFMVASKTDSRIIIDQMGAEKLLGKGDMLYASSTDPFPVRIQGAFVSDQEVENVVEAAKAWGEPEYIDDEIFVPDDDEEAEDMSIVGNDGEDPLYDKALEIVVQAGKASASYIQRRLKIGYNRAARLVEEMEARGIVGPANGSKPRELIHIP